MLRRQRSGSVVCPSCGQLVGVRDETCLNCGRRNPGMWGFASLLRRLGGDMGFVPFVLYACGTLYVCTLVVHPSGIGMGGLSILAPSGWALFLFGASGAVPVFRLGHWWTVLSAAWLHGGLIHIAFNMMWVRSLAPAATHLYGGARTIIIYTLSSVTGFLASSFVGAFMPFLPSLLRGSEGITVGASAPVFGLLGALIYFGRRGGSSLVGDQAKRWAGLLFVFGFIFPGVDNWAHLGGLLGGYATARWLDPLKPERVEHVLAALACLGLTVISILVSVVVGREILPRG